jgi:hypothetical protein
VKISFFLSIVFALHTLFYVSIVTQQPYKQRAQLSHSLVFESRRATEDEPFVSAICGVLDKDSSFLSGWLQNIVEQFACPNTEIILGIYTDAVLKIFQGLLEKEQTTCTFKAVLFSEDPGIYETWDILIQHYARGEVVTHAALDDRRENLRLRDAIDLFQRDPSVAVVSFPVHVITERKADVGVWWAFKETAPLSASMLVKTNASDHVSGSENIPHCSPVWRRTLHDHVGFFAGSYNACDDWAFFLRVSLGGHKIMHLSGSAGVRYMIREKSHNRRENKRSGVDCVDAVISGMQLQSLGLYNNLAYTGFNVQRKNILFITEAAPVKKEGGNLRLMEVLRFLSLNGHSVRLVVRTGPWGKSALMDELHRLNIEVVVESDYDQMSETALQACLAEFDLVFLHAWFWPAWQVNKHHPSPGLLARFSMFFQTSHLTSQGGLLSELQCLRKPLVVLSDDVHHVRCRQILAANQHAVCDSVREDETKVYSRATLVLAISGQDADTFSTLGAQTVAALPYVIKQRPIFSPLSSRFRLTFIGSGHEGNLLALQWFFESVAPLLSMRDMTVTIAGSNAWKTFVQGKRINADVVDTDDIVQVLAQTRVLFAPVLVGGTGISTKTFDAFAYGIPTVTTLEGSYGIPIKTQGLAVVPKETPLAFAQAVLLFWRNETHWRLAQTELTSRAALFTSTAWLQNTHLMNLLQH